MKKAKTVINIFKLIFSLIVAFGFVNIFSIIIKESLANVFILVTLPIVIGSLLLNNKKFYRQGLIFLLASIFLITGILVMFGVSGSFESLVARGMLYIGAIIFSWSLVTLWEKVIDEIFIKKAY